MVNFGVVLCFFIDSVSYIAVIFGLLLIKTEHTEVKNISHNVFQDVKDGLKYIRENEALVINSLIAAAICTFAFNNDVIIPVFAKTVLHQGARVYTNLMSAVGIGAFIGAMVMATIAKNGVRKNMFLYDSVLLSSLQVLMLFVRNFYLSFIMLALIGFVGISFLNLCNSIYQVNSIDQYRGRVMSVYAFLNQGSTPLGNLYVGSVMERFSGISGFPACGTAALICLIPIFIYKRNTIVSWLKN